MIAVDLGQHIAPVIVVLDEIALRKSNAVADVLAGDVNCGDVKVAGFVVNTLDAAVSNGDFVQHGRAESVCPAALYGALPGVVGASECGDGCWSAVGVNGTEDAEINTIVVEIFVRATEVLGAVTEVRAVEYSVVRHDRRTRQVIRGGRSAGARENIVCRLVYAAEGHGGGDRKLRQNLGSQGVRIVCLGPRNEPTGLRGRIGFHLVTSGRGRA